MRESHRPLTRWLAGIAVVVGLLAMHGLTASTASSAAHCGDMPTHISTGQHDDALSAPGPIIAMGVNGEGTDAGHAGALCVAILIAGITLAGFIRRERCPVPVRLLTRDASRPLRLGRAPPGRAELSVWRN